DPAMTSPPPAGIDYGPTGSGCADPGPDQTRIQQWLDLKCYVNWQHDPVIRSSGPLYVEPSGKLVDDASHHRVQIYYSNGVVDWLHAGRPEGGIPDGSGIVKVMFPTSDRVPNADELIGYATILRRQDLSLDGWFWSIYFTEPGHMAPM